MNTPKTIAKVQTKVNSYSWDEVERNLPPLLRNGVEILDTVDEKKLFAMSMIAASSSLFTRIKGVYDRKRIYSNLFMICQAPPASGKGLMAGARVALAKIHDELIKQSKFKQVLYKEQFAHALKNKTAPPNKPPFTVLFMPGNCTSSRMIQHLHDNGPNPILILETEASTLASANKSQYGDFSDIVRKAFHGETISYTRKFNEEFLEVNEPKLAIVLSGTPDQIIKLIGTPEDGTFSRYMFFSFNGGSDWRDVNCKDCTNFSDLLETQQEEYLKLWKSFADRDVTFDLTSNQWDEVNALFREEYNTVASATNNTYALGAVKRHGVMLFKMCMVLTAFRMYHTNDTDNLIECQTKDLEIAKYLVSVSLESSLAVLEQLPTPQLSTRTKDKKGLYIERLNERFSRAEAVALGPDFGVTSRTIDRWLEKMVEEGKIVPKEYGHYQKLMLKG